MGVRGGWRIPAASVIMFGLVQSVGPFPVWVRQMSRTGAMSRLWWSDALPGSHPERVPFWSVHIWPLPLAWRGRAMPQPKGSARRSGGACDRPPVPATVALLRSRWRDAPDRDGVMRETTGDSATRVPQRRVCFQPTHMRSPPPPPSHTTGCESGTGLSMARIPVGGPKSRDCAHGHHGPR